MKIPAFLKIGDKVAIVATAKRQESDVGKAIKAIESWGLKPVFSKNALNSDGYFAGTDDQKVHDLQSALDAEDVKAIIFLRGGYGTSRIIDRIDFSTFEAKPKWCVGFSDLTCFLLKSETLNVAAIHGPMCLTIGNDDFSDNALKDLLFGVKRFNFPISRTNEGGAVEASITGGNLSLIYESIGTSNEIETAGKVLFLEEVGEEMYSLDRMMNKLKRIGKLENVTGLILGSFTSISNSKSYFSESPEELINNYFTDIEIPIVEGLNAGHEKQNFPLIFGQKAKIEVTKEALKLEYLN